MNNIKQEIILIPKKLKKFVISAKINACFETLKLELCAKIIATNFKKFYHNQN